MPPQPLESVQSTTGGNFVPNNEAPRSGTISLGMLIDFIIQKTYHDLTVLAELLPRKTDLDRKIEIYDFAARTRQLFIRLLALVKWANSASKVDKSSHIMSFLDKQSMLFVDTADTLARMARETLVHARLPNFHIPAAVEILTTGTYSRLPACIRDKIVPPDPITAVEKRNTLSRLNQVIQHRLVTGQLLPQMRKFKIENGRVTFQVDHEFEVSLTVMGDAPDVPWRLLDIEVLVEDKETGDGKALVHSLQVNYIHQVVQSRLVDGQNALGEVFHCLHYFCQSLQLEVLYTQTIRLMMDRLDENIHIDQYVPGVKLIVSYWRELTSKDPRSELGYRFTVQTDPTDSARPLTVLHMPSISTKDSTEIANRSVRSDHLSMERLLVHVVYVRSLARLNDIKVEFQTFMKDVDYHLQGTPAILTVPVLHPCLRAEQIHITVDTHTGMLRCHVPKHLDCPIVADLQTALNNDMSKLPTLISELRYWITQRRCEKTLQHLPASAHEKLSLLHPPDHPIAKIGRHKVYVKMHRQPNVVMIIEIREKPDTTCEMDYKFYLINVKPTAIDEEPSASSAASGKSETNVPKIFLRVRSFVELDAFIVTHGPGTPVDEISSSHKRKSSIFEASVPPAKMQKTIYPAYFIPELAHVVAMCDEKLPFVDLAQELTKRQMAHSGLQSEANSTSLVLKLLTFPMPENKRPNGDGPSRSKSLPVIDKPIWEALTKRLLSVALRTQFKSNNNNRFWMAELIFFETPLKSKHNREQGQRRPVYFQYELGVSESVDKTVDSLLEDWSRIVYLYCLVHDFADQFKNELNLQNHVTIKSYSYTNLLIGYGPNREVTVNVFWCTDSKEYKLIFNGGNSAINAHSMMQEQLQSHLNRHHNLSQTVHLLHETYQPLSSIAKLPIIPQLGIKLQRPQIPVLSFCILPQSPTLLRVSYQTMYCMEIRLRGGGLVSIRDGAYSRFDRSNVIEEFTPTQGLKGFLSKYVDENAVYRRQSQSEDDNPPSPITMEDSHSGSPAFFSPRDCGLRFQQPNTPPSCSNPHTPASPHPISQSQNQSHPSFSMTSPTGPHLPHPSPGGIVMPSSPLNPQPSPMAIANSPGPNLGYMHPDSSPFAAMSPAASNWPGSPMPRPSPRPGQSPEHKHQAQANVPHLSRVLPARSWAGAVPTLLTNEALDTLCRPSAHPQKEIGGPELSPLERFLGCVSMRRHLQRFIQSEDCLTYIPSTEPGVVLFKADLLQCQVTLNPTHMQALHIKISPSPAGDGKPPVQWSTDELQTIERFFELRVAAPPYRPNALSGFGRALNVPPQVLKDFIQLMQLDMMAEPLPGQKWTMQFIMRVPPPALVHIVSVGNPALYISNQKILFFVQLTRVPYLPGMDWKDSTTIVLPLVYVVNSNITQLVERRDQSPTPIAVEAGNQLRHFAEYPNPNGECSLFPAVRDLLMNLTMPNEAHPQQQGPQMPNQITPSPVGAIGASPNPMIHSPMQQMGQGPHTPTGNNPDVGNQGAPGPNMPPQAYGMGGPNQVPN